ncbi:MAG: hypothetical protein J3K34DRAFT_469693 [Monoraphidium minutum]|nr:MAG: hypothetical protein J3K34DRAFT_469693 [Monoraphidium minutum]
MGILGWTRRDVPDLGGKTALVTGANSGIGFELTRQLVEHGAEVIMVGRSEQLVKWAARDLEEEFPGARLHPKTCDLEDPKQVDALAQDVLNSKMSIDILACNAGRFLDAPFALSKGGFEQQLASNFFGHCQLTLLPGSRIINVSSPAEQFGRVDLTDIKGTKAGTSGMLAYGRSKAMQIMWNHELQRRLRLARKDVDCFAVHPGLVSTGLTTKFDLSYPSATASYIAMMLIGQAPLQGAQSSLYAATAPQLRGKGGIYIGPQYTTNLFHARERSAVNPAVYDYDARVKLFEATRDALSEAAGREMPTLPAVGAPIVGVNAGTETGPLAFDPALLLM